MPRFLVPKPGLQTIKMSQNGLVWSGPKWGTEGAQIKWSGLVWSSLAGENNGLIWSGPLSPVRKIKTNGLVWSGPIAKRNRSDVDEAL